MSLSGRIRAVATTSGARRPSSPRMLPKTTQPCRSHSGEWEMPGADEPERPGDKDGNPVKNQGMLIFSSFIPFPGVYAKEILACYLIENKMLYYKDPTVMAQIKG